MKLEPDKNTEIALTDTEKVKLVARLDNLLLSNPIDALESYSLKKTGFQIGQYSIERAIGSGGFGVVYLARDLQLDRLVALKVPRPEVLVNSEKLRRFRSEATLTAKLNHPLIVAIYEANLDSTTPYIASEFCDGPNLMQWLEQNDATRVAPETAAQLVKQIASAVSHAHQQGIVHRDLKPANIILVPTIKESHQIESNDTARPVQTGTLEQFTPRVTDFGLARLQQQVIRETTSSLLLGSPNYMSPEQAEGQLDDAGPRSDIFSLGTILYELLTGVAPFEAESFSRVLQRLRDDVPDSIVKQRPDVHRDLETICLKCLEKLPDDRFESAEELATELARFVAGQPIAASRLSWLRRVRNWSFESSRVHELMMAVIAISFVRGVFAFTAMLTIVLSETEWTFADLFSAFKFYVLIATSIDGGIAYAAWRNARQSLPRLGWWAVMITLCGGSGSCFSTAILPSLATGYYQLHSGARVTTFSLLAILFAGQAVCWWLGDWRRIQKISQRLI